MCLLPQALGPLELAPAEPLGPFGSSPASSRDPSCLLPQAAWTPSSLLPQGFRECASRLPQTSTDLSRIVLRASRGPWRALERPRMRCPEEPAERPEVRISLSTKLAQIVKLQNPREGKIFRIRIILIGRQLFSAAISRRRFF